MHEPVVTVVLAGDDNVARSMAVAIRSAFEVSKNKSALEFFVIEQMSEGVREKIRLSCPDASIRFVPAGKLTSALPAGVGRTSDLTSAAWLRVFIADLLPEVERVIYLDADTLVRRDLRTLSEVELFGKPLGAVIDDFPTFAETKLTGIWGDKVFDGSEPYFNSGVLVCDLDAWRALHISDQIQELVAEYGEQLAYGDQDALNVVFANQWTEIDGRWNNRAFSGLIRRRKSQERIEAELENAAIVHYVTPVKPWRQQYPDSIGKDIYFEIEARTAFAGSPVEVFDTPGWQNGVWAAPVLN